MNSFDISESVLDPLIIRCAGNCYRLLGKQHPAPKESAEHEGLYLLGLTGSPRNALVDCIPNKGELFELVLPDIQKCYFKFIIGKKGDTIRKLSRRYNVTVDIPSNPDEYLSTIIIIESEIKSEKADSLIQAKEFIENIVRSNCSRISPNYFISIPMINSEILSNFIAFKTKVISDSECKGITQSLFVSENKLHVTVLMLNLFEENEKVRKRTFKLKKKMIVDFNEVIRVVSDELLKNVQLYLTVQGLEIMGDDPLSTNILYANVTEPSNAYRWYFELRFRDIVDLIYQKLRNHPFSNGKFDRDSVKIHISLMKSYFDRKPVNDGPPSKSFDSTAILAAYFVE